MCWHCAVCMGSTCLSPPPFSIHFQSFTPPHLSHLPCCLFDSIRNYYFFCLSSVMLLLRMNSNYTNSPRVKRNTPAKSINLPTTMNVLLVSLLHMFSKMWKLSSVGKMSVCCVLLSTELVRSILVWPGPIVYWYATGYTANRLQFIWSVRNKLKFQHFSVTY